jgi:hypothetical protein
MGIKAYHGSPHSFERFDASKIGTGEGAQAYGHGLYLAENEGVARQYRDNLSQMPGGRSSGRKGYKIDGTVVAENDLTPAQSKAIDEVRQYGGDVDKALDVNRRYVEHTKRPNPELLSEIAALKGKTIEDYQPGHMYEVDIAAEPEHFLDWDKPLTEQGEGAKNAIREVINSRPWSERHGIERDDPTGEDFYDLLKMDRRRAWEKQHPGDVPASWEMAPWAQGASEQLREAGVPGIKYLDQGSRLPIDYGAQIRFRDGKWNIDKEYIKKYNLPQTFNTYAEAETALRQAAEGAGTRNYVVFDDKLISILKKYGLPISAAGLAALSQLHPQEAQAQPLGDRLQGR